MTVVTILPDGRIMARAALAAANRSSAGILAQSVTLTDLRKVEYLLQANINSDADTDATVKGSAASTNVVGLSIYVGAGTTISGEVIAIGF